jgi:hypothetical protein
MTVSVSLNDHNPGRQDLLNRFERRMNANILTITSRLSSYRQAIVHPEVKVLPPHFIRYFQLVVKTTVI